MPDVDRNGHKAGLRVSDDLTLPLSAVTEVVTVLATRGAGKSFGSADFAEELTDAGLQFVVVDPMGVYWGLRSSYDGTSEGLPVVVLGGERGDVPLEPTSGKLIADVVVDTGQSFVIDLSLFDSKAEQVRFMEAFCERLFYRKGPLEQRTPVLLIVDEADEFAPQKPQANEARMLGHMIRLAKRGRTRGIGLLSLTQRSAEFAKAILDLSSAVVFMRTAGPRDRRAIKDWMKGSAPELVALADERFPRLDTGQALVHSPHWLGLEEPALIKFRMIRTFDSYRTPEPGERAEAPRVLAEIDLAALGAEIAATVERAKENDPAELRKRIRDLERELSSQTSDAPPVEVIVEVPVLTEEDRAKLSETGERLNELVEQTHAATRVFSELAPAINRAAQADQGTHQPPSATASQAIREVTPVWVKTDESERMMSSNGSLGSAARRFLETLGRHHPAIMSVSQMAVLAGRKARGGSFNTAMRELRDGGYIEDLGGNVRLSARGVSEAGVTVGNPLTPDEVIEQWRQALPVAAVNIFDVLVEAHPSTVPVEEISERTGRQPRGGSWNTALKTLTSNGLAEKTSDGLRATDFLFT